MLSLPPRTPCPICGHSEQDDWNNGPTDDHRYGATYHYLVDGRDFTFVGESSD
jgi:hypothetical protein